MRKSFILSGNIFPLILLVIISLLFVSLPYRPFVVLSGSMEPAVQTGSLIIADTENLSPNAGDIAVFRLQNTIITHRVIRRETDGSLVTKGDSNEIEDPVTLSDEQILGTAIFSVPYLGYVSLILRKLFPFLFLIFIVICVYPLKEKKGRK